MHEAFRTSAMWPEWVKAGLFPQQQPKQQDKFGVSQVLIQFIKRLKFKYWHGRPTPPGASADALSGISSLVERTIGDEGATAMATALKTNSTTLPTLDLVFSQVRSAGCVMLGQGLSMNSSLTEIRLSANQIGDEGATAMGTALITNHTLTTLDLGDCQIGSAGCVVLGEGLGVNSSLIEICLAANKIGDEGATAIGMALMKNCTLTTLDLGNCNIGSEGCVLLSQGLAINSSLIGICLADNMARDKTSVADTSLAENTIGDKGAMAMGTALKTNCTLKTLDLARCGISSNGCAALCDSLFEAAHTIALSELSLDNEVAVRCPDSFPEKTNTLHGAQAVRRMLTAVTSLTNLRLKNYLDGETACATLCKGIANNSTLRVLDLRGVYLNTKEGIQDEAKDGIIKAVASNASGIKIFNDFGLQRGPAHGRGASQVQEDLPRRIEHTARKMVWYNHRRLEWAPKKNECNLERTLNLLEGTYSQNSTS